MVLLVFLQPEVRHEADLSTEEQPPQPFHPLSNVHPQNLWLCGSPSKFHTVDEQAANPEPSSQRSGLKPCPLTGSDCQPVPHKQPKHAISSISPSLTCSRSSCLLARLHKHNDWWHVEICELDLIRASEPMAQIQLVKAEIVLGEPNIQFVQHVVSNGGTDRLQLVVAAAAAGLFVVDVAVTAVPPGGQAASAAPSQTPSPPTSTSPRFSCLAEVQKLVEFNHGRVLSVHVDVGCLKPSSMQHPLRSTGASSPLESGCILVVFALCVVCVARVSPSAPFHSAGVEAVLSAWRGVQWPVQWLDAAPGSIAIQAQVYDEPPSSMMVAPACFLHNVDVPMTEPLAFPKLRGFLGTSGRRLQLLRPHVLLNSFMAASQDTPLDVVSNPEGARRQVLPWQAALRPGACRVLPCPMGDGASVVTWPMKASPDALQDCTRSVVFPMEHLLGTPWSRRMLPRPRPTPMLALVPSASWLLALPAAQSMALAALSRLTSIGTEGASESASFAVLSSLGGEQWKVPPEDDWAPVSAFSTPMDPHLPHSLHLHGADHAAVHCDGSVGHLRGVVAVAGHCAVMLHTCVLPLLQRACSLARQNVVVAARQRWKHALHNCKSLLQALKRQIRVECLRLARVRAIGLAALRCLLLATADALLQGTSVDSAKPRLLLARGSAYQWLGRATALHSSLAAADATSSLQEFMASLLNIPAEQVVTAVRSGPLPTVMDALPVTAFTRGAAHAIGSAAWALKAAAQHPPTGAVSDVTLVADSLLSLNCISGRGTGAPDTQQLLCALTMLPIPPNQPQHAQTESAAQEGQARHSTHRPQWVTRNILGEQATVLLQAQWGLQARDLGSAVAVPSSAQTASLAANMF